MKRIFLFPTVDEAKAFLLTEPRDPVFVGGVGSAEITAATIKAVKAKKPHLVILCGFAGAYDRQTLQRGEVVEVVTERMAGVPERYGRLYETSGPETGLTLAAGLTVNSTGEGVRQAVAVAAENGLPAVEQMEGAAFFAVCEALGVTCCQIRVISNYVGDKAEEWSTEEAAASLTRTLTKIFGNDEQQQ